VRIRHYGYLANRGRVQRIAALKARLGEPELPSIKAANTESKEEYDPIRCPHCGQLALKLIAIQRGRARPKGRALPCATVPHAEAVSQGGQTPVKEKLCICLLTQPGD